MKSPFPGMDPYFEQHWRDVHARLVIYSCDALQGRLPTDLIARVEERVYVEREGEPERSSYPDVRVIEHKRDGASAVAIREEAQVAEPMIITMRENEPVTETFIEILDASTGNRVLTVIEFVSPTNKTPGVGHDLYRQKQKEVEQARVSLVEIDLLLGGKRAVSVPLSRIKFKHRTRYQAVVRRGWKWHEAEVYALPLRQPLPTISVPLRQSDQDALLNLQQILELAYEKGRYDRIDYQTEPDPPLTGDDAAWADQLLRAAGKRK